MAATSLKNWRSACAGFWQAGIHFVYPPLCPLCGHNVILDEGSTLHGPVFCHACLQELTQHIEYACQRCAAPVGPHLDTSQGCIHCRNERFHFQAVIRLGVYEHRLRAACLRAKRRGQLSVAAALAYALWEQEHRSFFQEPIDLIVPVPQFWGHRLARSHNTAATIGQVLARCLKVDYSAHILSKARKTPSQSRLPASKRRHNLRDAFRICGGATLSNMTILLVDDVLTTGSTANEAAKVLVQAGAERVVAAVIARGLGKYS